jgi:hypothetical protein
MEIDRTAVHRRACATCQPPLRLLRTLAAIGKLLAQRIFLCTGRNLAMADPWNVRAGGELSTEGGAEPSEGLFPWPTEVHFSGTSDWLGFQKHKWRLDAG